MEETNERTLNRVSENKNNKTEFPEENEEVSQDSVIIYSEAEKPVRLTWGFKLLLGIGIFLSGFISVPFLFLFTGWCKGLANITEPFEFIWKLKVILFYFIIFLCFIMLVSIAISRKPFNSVLYRFGIVIGILVTASAFVLPRIEGYDANIQILSYEGHFVADGSYLLVGLLILVMALLMRYGYKYQNNSDMTI